MVSRTRIHNLCAPFGAALKQLYCQYKPLSLLGLLLYTVNPSPASVVSLSIAARRLIEGLIHADAAVALQLRRTQDM